MKNVIKRLSFAIVFTILFFTASLGFTQSQGDNVKTYLSKSGKLAVKMTVSPANCQFSPHWLNEKRAREGCIAGMQVNRDGVEALFPDFSYNFLGDIKSVEVNEMIGTFTLKLTGGDASSSYVAIYSFEHNVLKRRRIHSASFPDEAWEDTTFGFNTNNK
jgi:hypothetical protein